MKNKNEKSAEDLKLIEQYDRNYSGETLIVRRKSLTAETTIAAKRVNIYLDGMLVSFDEQFVKELVASGFFEIVEAR